MALMPGFRRLFRRPPPEVRQDVDAELELHLEMKARELIDDGLGPEEAHREARRRFGDLASIRRQCVAAQSRIARVAARNDWIGALLSDLRYAVRTFRRSPGFTVVVLLTLALGIGATTTVFSVVNAVLLRSFPYADPDRLVMVAESTEVYPFFGVAPANFLDWRERNTVFEDMAAIKANTVTLTGEGEPQRVVGRRVSASFFPILGVEPALGRTFLPEEDRPDGQPVVILANGLWRRRFGADLEILGRTVLVGETPRTVIGVMPQEFRFLTSSYDPQDVDVWLPYPFDRDPPTERSSKRLQVIARLAPGVTLERAREEMDAIARGLQEAYPDTNTDWGVYVGPFKEVMVSQVRSTLLILLGAVLFVLLIACVNVANLLLARGVGRSKEMAIRTSIGAGRPRLVRQLLTEGAVIGLVGAGLGLALARVGIPLLVRITPATIPRLDEAGIDGRVLAFTAGIALLTALIFGLAPALQGSRIDLTTALKAGGAGVSEGRARLRGRNLLVVAEVGLALVLSVGAGLMANSFFRLHRVDPGIDPEALLVAEVNLPRTKYAEQTGFGSHEYTERFILWTVLPEQTALVEEVVRRLETEPDVVAAAAVSYPPVSGRGWSGRFAVEGRPPPESPEEQGWGYAKAVTPGYFRTVGIPILRGRTFTEADRESAPDVVIINRAIAEKTFDGVDPIGARLLLQDGVEDEERPFEIVGIVGTVKQEGPAVREPEHIFYIPYRQQAPAWVDWQIAFRMRVSFVARTRGDPAALAPAVRSAVWAVDPDQPVQTVRTMEEIIAVGLAERRLYGILLGIFAGIGSLLAALGVYGLMAYTVTQRIHEIGIRMALGAHRSEVMGMVLRRGLVLALGGIAIGVAGSLALTRLIASQLYGVSPTDPVTLAVVSIALLAIALAATFVPARRATRVDAMESLRYE